MVELSFELTDEKKEEIERISREVIELITSTGLSELEMAYLLICISTSFEDITGVQLSTALIEEK